ncbi:MAG: S1C family serine protease, partial [Bacteroidota bacterium]|nr:S1C family serine protease [Bacteroidota bacterium]
MTFKKFIAVFLISAASFTGGAWVYGKYTHQDLLAADIPGSSSVFKTAKFSGSDAATPMTDFENAAAKASPAVVHIKVLKRGGNQIDIFGGMSSNDNGGEAQQVASGSGVIVSPNGYVATNNHVV